MWQTTLVVALLAHLTFFCWLYILYIIVYVTNKNLEKHLCEFLENLLHTSTKNHLFSYYKNEVASEKSSSIICLQFLYGFLHYFRAITWFYLSVQIHLELFYSMLSAKEFHRNYYTCFCLLNYACLATVITSMISLTRIVGFYLNLRVAAHWTSFI